MNDVKLLGRLTRDPETRYTQAGSPVARFDLAVNAGKDSTEYFHIVAFSESAEFVSKYLTKGRQIVVSGHLHNNKWTDKNNQNRVTTEIIADRIYFADSKQNDGQQAAGEPALGDGFMDIPEGVGEELPFN